MFLVKHVFKVCNKITCNLLEFCPLVLHKINLVVDSWEMNDNLDPVYWFTVSFTCDKDKSAPF